MSVDPSRDPFRVTFSRTAGGARRVASWGSGPSNPFARLALSLAILVFGVLLLIALIPLLLIIVVGLLVLSVYLRIRFWWAARKNTTPTDTGRENVRVIRRE